MNRFRTLMAGIAAASALAILAPTPHSAQAACGYTYTKQEGKGGVSGAVTARHYLRSDYCWTSTSVSSGSNTMHRVEEVGWTSWMLDVESNGNSISKIGTKYRAIGYAYCKVSYGLGTRRVDTYITHELKPGGVIGKVVPAWSC